MQPMHWDNLRHFLAVARSGSLSGAARRLRVNPATVLRRIQQLEQELETRLFLREPSGYVRTSAGERLMARAEALEQEIFACQETVGGRNGRRRTGGDHRDGGPRNLFCFAASFRAQSGVPGTARRTASHRADAQSVYARGGYCAAVGEAVPTRSARATDCAA